MKKRDIVIIGLVTLFIYSYLQRFYTADEALDLAALNIGKFCASLGITEEYLSTPSLHSEGKHYHDITWIYKNGTQVAEIHAIFDNADYYFSSVDTNTPEIIGNLVNF